ncbi:MAG TPA: ATPase, T2SS/T4P/T4SS family [Sedimentisphaerales bacterium]|nr:Flp pilus assembly complex ATPase component TadA [Phycisphaerae bacterium]HON90556.1 ATPase, T2SS/T4P/T4SS family [Sedimentisphaerales bacterium]HQI26809.1 ATPase, T2SS/T4P/T4SS family [Sedimentisphaerales bacterium]
MTGSLLMAVEYGGYISIVKLVVFLACYFPWLLLVSWAYKDAKAVETSVPTWIGILLGGGVLAILVWWLMPLFIVGVLAYVLLVGGTALAYVKHRNTHVLDFDKILTIDHIKSLFTHSEKLHAMENFTFITTNNNEVPPPEPRTPTFFGYRTAYDVLTDAIWRRTSTISFSPKGDVYEVVYNIDGAATQQPPLPRDQMEYLIHFLKEVAGLDTKEKRKPQKGKFRTRQVKVITDWEVQTAGSTAGEQVRLKRITKESAMRLGDLGLTQDQFEQLDQLRQTKQGLFLVTGPKKSGITTTMYALIRNHDAFLNNINTIEKQPTGQLLNVTQTVFSLTDTGTSTYARKLQSIVRMGADVVGVGECEDAETAKIASAAAKDGKIVYVVMEADSVLQAMARWLKFVEDRKLVAETLIGISNQRLLRKLCETCKQGYAPNKELLKKFNLPADKAKVLYRPGKEIFDKRGKPSMCEECQGTGFIGRTGVFEMIVLDDELKKAVRTVKQLPELGMQFRKAKMLYMQEQALRKVIAGTTAINEMLRVLASPKKEGAPASQ